MGPGTTVRELHPDDHRALAELSVAAFRGLLGDDLDRGYVAELADVAGRSSIADVLVAEDERGELVGTITYVPGPGPLAWFDDPDEAGLRMLAVAPSAQGRGVGAALVAAGIDRAVAAGKRRILLHTTAPMTTAHRLYERAGLRDPGRDVTVAGGLHLLAYTLDLGGGR